MDAAWQQVLERLVAPPRAGPFFYKGRRFPCRLVCRAWNAQLRTSCLRNKLADVERYLWVMDYMSYWRGIYCLAEYEADRKRLLELILGSDCGLRLYDQSTEQRAQWQAWAATFGLRVEVDDAVMLFK